MPRSTPPALTQQHHTAIEMSGVAGRPRGDAGGDNNSVPSWRRRATTVSIASTIRSSCHSDFPHHDGAGGGGGGGGGDPDLRQHLQSVSFVAARSRSTSPRLSRGRSPPVDTASKSRSPPAAAAVLRGPKSPQGLAAVEAGRALVSEVSALLRQLLRVAASAEQALAARRLAAAAAAAAAAAPVDNLPLGWAPRLLRAIARESLGTLTDAWTSIEAAANQWFEAATFGGAFCEGGMDSSVLQEPVVCFAGRHRTSATNEKATPAPGAVGGFIDPAAGSNACATEAAAVDFLDQVLCVVFTTLRECADDVAQKACGGHIIAPTIPAPLPSAAAARGHHVRRVEEHEVLPPQRRSDSLPPSSLRRSPPAGQQRAAGIDGDAAATATTPDVARGRRRALSPPVATAARRAGRSPAAMRSPTRRDAFPVAGRPPSVRRRDDAGAVGAVGGNQQQHRGAAAPARQQPLPYGDDDDDEAVDAVLATAARDATLPPPALPVAQSTVAVVAPQFPVDEPITTRASVQRTAPNHQQKQQQQQQQHDVPTTAAAVAPSLRKVMSSAAAAAPTLLARPLSAASLQAVVGSDQQQQQQQQQLLLGRRQSMRAKLGFGEAAAGMGDGDQHHDKNLVTISIVEGSNVQQQAASKGDNNNNNEGSSGPRTPEHLPTAGPASPMTSPVGAAAVPPTPRYSGGGRNRGNAVDVEEETGGSYISAQYLRNHNLQTPADARDARGQHLVQLPPPMPREPANQTTTPTAVGTGTPADATPRDTPTGLGTPMHRAQQLSAKFERFKARIHAVSGATPPLTPTHGPAVDEGWPQMQQSTIG